MLLQVLKAQGATKKEADKEPTKSINLALKDTTIVKDLKNLKDIKRDALLARFYMKCLQAHCDRFFAWRDKYEKLRITQRIVVMNAIQEEYSKENPNWISNKIYKLSEVKIPPSLSMEQAQVQYFQKLINIIYPPNT